MTEANKVIFTETPCNRDGEEICIFIIGYGYGIFGALTTTEIGMNTTNNYKSAIAVIGYKTVTSPDIIIDGESYSQQATEPEIDTARLKYKCTWRGNIYTISGVSKKYSINGDFIGYRIYSENN